MVRPAWTAERDATMRFANECTRAVQHQQMERTHIQLTSVEKTPFVRQLLSAPPALRCPRDVGK
jgi:hypothetical protein